MADPQLDGLFASLEAAYGAALAREEEAGAADLAFGLLQDRPLADELCARGHVLVWDGGASAPVIAAGEDYVVAGRGPVLIVPAAAAELVAREGEAPARPWDSTLVTILRRLARSRTRLELLTATGVRSGTLVSASGDHVILEGSPGRWAVGSHALRAIRLPTLGSTDEL